MSIGYQVEKKLNMLVLRSDIERALDEIISDEGGMKFQGLAVVLGKQRWPDLIACERKKDLGADAIARASVAADGIGKALVSSLTAELSKVRNDAREIKEHHDDIHLLIFYTPRKVTNYTSHKWAADVLEKFGYELVVMTREEIMTSLMLPSNASLCRAFLGITVPFEESAAELLRKVREATSELTASRSNRIAGKLLLDLRTVELDRDGKETGAIFHLKDLHTYLAQSRRLVLEAPAGRGKTTTLVQLANLHVGETGTAFLIDLPLWTQSGLGLLQFIAGMRQFQARFLDAVALARLNETEHFSFLLNGWNEISESDFGAALNALRDIERNFPSAGIIVATRAHVIVPPLPGALRLKLLPLNRAERAEYLRGRLGNKAHDLRFKLDREPVLDDLTRTPFILSGVCDIYESGASIPTTRMGVLRAIIGVVEESDEHRGYLQLPPLAGRASDYLTDLGSMMTTQGQVTIPEEQARPIVSSTASKLRDAGQLASVPEPAAVLNALCTRHVLERQRYPGVTFRFEHQQFQEYFAASRAKADLWQLLHTDSAAERREYLRYYVNEPSWAEPLHMIAEEIGAQTIEIPEDVDAVTAGENLVNMALGVDPVFAAELSRLCGRAVWTRVRNAVAERLRSWYRLSDPHQQCALAGMLATASDDFNDIVLPLFSHDDRQTRLELFGRGRELHLSTLGPDWRRVASGWKEEARVDFVSGMIHNGGTPETVVDFALADPSMNVRKAAISAFVWIGSDEETAALLSKLDAETLEEVLRELPTKEIPVQMRPRVRTIYQELYRNSADTLTGLRCLLKTAEMGDTSIADELRAQLSRLDPGKMEDREDYLIVPALEIIRGEDPEWVSRWVAERIVDGTLWREDWMKFVAAIPEGIKQGLLERLENEDVGHSQLSRSILLLAPRSDLALAARLFGKLCALRGGISEEPNVGQDLNRNIQRQVIELF